MFAEVMEHITRNIYVDACFLIFKLQGFNNNRNDNNNAN